MPNDTGPAPTTPPCGYCGHSHRVHNDDAPVCSACDSGSVVVGAPGRGAYHRYQAHAWHSDQDLPAWERLLKSGPFLVVLVVVGFIAFVTGACDKFGNPNF